jgi:hypothetical protein
MRFALYNQSRESTKKGEPPPTPSMNDGREELSLEGCDSYRSLLKNFHQTEALRQKRMSLWLRTACRQEHQEND